MVSRLDLADGFSVRSMMEVILLRNRLAAATATALVMVVLVPAAYAALSPTPAAGTRPGAAGAVSTGAGRSHPVVGLADLPRAVLEGASNAWCNRYTIVYATIDSNDWAALCGPGPSPGAPLLAAFATDAAAVAYHPVGRASRSHGPLTTAGTRQRVIGITVESGCRPKAVAGYCADTDLLSRIATIGEATRSSAPRFARTATFPVSPTPQTRMATGWGVSARQHPHGPSPESAHADPAGRGAPQRQSADRKAPRSR